MKLSKEEFLKKFEAIIIYKKEQERFMNGLEMMLGETCVFSELGCNLFDAYILTLEELMEDKYENISYYVYEIEMGKKGKDVITLGDGKIVSLCSPEDLYDYLASA